MLLLQSSTSQDIEWEDTTNVALDFKEAGANIPSLLKNDAPDDLVILRLRRLEDRAKNVHRFAQPRETHPYMDENSERAIKALIEQATWLAVEAEIWLEVDWNPQRDGMPPTFRISDNPGLSQQVKKGGVPGAAIPCPSVEAIARAARRLSEEERQRLIAQLQEWTLPSTKYLVGFDHGRVNSATGGIFRIYKPVGGTRTVGSFEYWFQWTEKSEHKSGHRSEYIAGHSESRDSLASNKARIYESVADSIQRGNAWSGTLQILQSMKRGGKKRATA